MDCPLHSFTVQIRRRPRFLEIAARAQVVVGRTAMQAGAVDAAPKTGHGDESVAPDILADSSRIFPFESDDRRAERDGAARPKNGRFDADGRLPVERAQIPPGARQGFRVRPFGEPRRRTVLVSLLRGGL